ncbi:MAG: 3-isopropylmalate dehydratase large subunit [Desulfohalobiaceae bacterium]|nr:3-isopropylmalate dehydratase large subunit [Desulfohalobiaceae bacterium]
MGHSLASKLLQAHTSETVDEPGQIVQCGVDLVLANDITAPLAIDSMERMGAERVFHPERVVLVCDHFTPNKDIDSAEQVKRVRDFAARAGIRHYYEGGVCGVEHALLPELGLVGPGDLVVGADSHTCTYGGLGAFATGLGSTDIAAAMVLGETWFKVPPSILVRLEGKPWRHVGGKDVVLHLLGRIGVDGALYKALEFFGPGIASMDAEARMTVANMAIEAGGKVGLFPADEVTSVYLRDAGRRNDIPLAADEDAEYESSLDIDLDQLEPQVACPHLPDNVRPVYEVEDIALDQVVIGSCTNGRISDLRQAAEILEGRTVAPGLRLIVLPATPRIYRMALEEGLLEIFSRAGAVIGPPTCGPCLGGHMGILAGGERCLATTNRNFKGRMGSLESEVFLGGPAVAAASAVAGRIRHPERI